METVGVWIFGAGENGRKCLEYLREQNEIEKVRGVIDNNPEKDNLKVDDITIYSYAKAVQMINKNKDEIIISCQKVYVDEIVRQLAKDNLQNLIKGVYCEEMVAYESLWNMSICSQFGEETGLKRVFRIIEGNDYKGIYVDVGAYHPFQWSNTKWAYDKGWRGINIDPNPDSIALFEVHRPEDININCGVSDEEGVLPFYVCAESARSSFESLADTKNVEKVINIPIRTLDSILEEFNISQIDILDIDAEGFDERIIKSVDLEKYQPKCILIEMLGEEKSHFWDSDVHHFLVSKGYRIEALFVKTLLYIRKDLF